MWGKKNHKQRKWCEKRGRRGAVVVRCPYRELASGAGKVRRGKEKMGLLDMLVKKKKNQREKIKKAITDGPPPTAPAEEKGERLPGFVDCPQKRRCLRASTP